jgi:hypothetical protein
VAERVGAPVRRDGVVGLPAVLQPLALLERVPGGVL